MIDHEMIPGDLSMTSQPIGERAAGESEPGCAKQASARGRGRDETAMRLDGTQTIIARYVRASGDVDAESIARETGIPAYIVRRYKAAIERASEQRRRFHTDEQPATATMTYAEEKLERLRQQHRDDYRKHRDARLAYQKHYDEASQPAAGGTPPTTGAGRDETR